MSAETPPPLTDTLDALREMIKTWRAIANDARPTASSEGDPDVLLRDQQYAETLTMCADQLAAALTSAAQPDERPIGVNDVIEVQRLTSAASGPQQETAKELVAKIGGVYAANGEPMPSMKTALEAERVITEWLAASRGGSPTPPEGEK